MNNSKEQGGMTEPASDTPTQHAEGGVEENESEPIKNTNEDHVESDSSKTIVEEQNKVSEQDEANNGKISTNIRVEHGGSLSYFVSRYLYRNGRCET
jgi:hypothetical protein